MITKSVDISPKAYSYIRFSRPEQALGDSERRQLDLARTFATKRGLVLDESLKPDRGISGFRGKNRKEGSLGQFLELIRQGKIARGSMLVVENIDRLSREGFNQVHALIRDITEAGITIQTISPECFYDDKSFESSLGFVLFGQIQMANQESLKKSERLLAARQNERVVAANGGRHPNTKNIPEWLEYKDQKFTLRPKAKATINQIFRWKAQGLGAGTIVGKLNDGGKEKYWASQKKGEWRASYVKKLLNNRQLIGEHQFYQIDGLKKRIPLGAPISGYYPEVVKPELFATVQKSLEGRRGTGGQTGKFNNALRGLMHCAYCGGPMHFEDKGTKRQPDGRYLLCERGKRHLNCERHRVKYDEALQLIIDNCAKLEPSRIIPSDDEQETKVGLLREQIKEKLALISENAERIANYDDQIGRTKDPGQRDRYEAKSLELQKQSEAATKACADLRFELEQAEKSRENLKAWQKDLIDLRGEIETSIEARQRLNSHLGEFISRIDVYRKGYAKHFEEIEYDQFTASIRPLGVKKKGKAPIARSASLQLADDIEFKLIAICGEAGIKIDSKVNEFIKQIKARRLSDEGRFYRVHFASGQVVDLAPEKSIADAARLAPSPDKDESSNERVYLHGTLSSKVAQLWEQFCKVQGLLAKNRIY